ncbi:hypothetical protein BHG07_07710 [Brenneria salicis ATCC 15712 = DSM 30166]|nr:hypothetical protein BHG07_07710 [Brenneria salicis ATCC 15712 = DSM 30166]
MWLAQCHQSGHVSCVFRAEGIFTAAQKMRLAEWPRSIISHTLKSCVALLKGFVTTVIKEANKKFIRYPSTIMTERLLLKARRILRALSPIINADINFMTEGNNTT